MELHTGANLVTFSIVGKTPVENEMLNISANWLEILFSNFNIFLAVLLGPTGLSGSSEDIMFYISDLLVGLREKEFWVLLFRKSEIFLCERLIFTLTFAAIVAK